MSRRLGRIVCYAIACGAATGCGPLPDPNVSSAPASQTLESGGRTRSYSVYVPLAADAAARPPIVLVLHGSGEGACGHVQSNGWLRKADEAGFVVVAPDALPLDPDRPAHPVGNPRMWSAGQPDMPPARASIDDAAFLIALMDIVAGPASATSPVCFVVGHSSGGSMAFKLGSTHAARWSGLGVVAAIDWVVPQPARPIPTLYVIGTADPLVPLTGGRQDLFWLRRTTPPVSETLQTWALALGCSAEPEIRRAGSGLERWTYGGCGDGVNFEALLIEGQGHGWPGGASPEYPAWIIGPSTDRLDATDAIWCFFEAVLAAQVAPNCHAHSTGWPFSASHAHDPDGSE